MFPGTKRREFQPYRGTSLIRKRRPVGPYSRTMPWALWKSWGGAVSYDRGTPVLVIRPGRGAKHVDFRRRFSPRKVDVRLPGKGNSNSHGARPVHLIITMIKWIRTSRFSISGASAPRSTPPAIMPREKDIEHSPPPHLWQTARPPLSRNRPSPRHAEPSRRHH